ncbi:hypothetical protein LINGRAHAP2_LOCUS19574, partial [Linum grandiflorum]
SIRHERFASPFWNIHGFSQRQYIHGDSFPSYLENERKEAVVKQEADLHFYSSKHIDMISNDDEEKLEGCNPKNSRGSHKSLLGRAI